MTAPYLGEKVYWPYGKGYASGIVVSVGKNVRNDRWFAIVEWKSRSRTRRIRRFVDQLVWTGKPFGGGA